ncbi:probable transcriptional regulator SLK3 isoform X2 [Jatropha curcas]|nr:probable transcriptional regulator SLK3 isoform X2 [Jatropha curcas]
MCKKLRLDIKQDAVLYQHIAQQQLQSGDKVQLQSHSPLLQTLIQQHKLEHQRQQKMLQFITDLPGVEMKKQRQQQMRDYLQQLELQQVHQMHPINSNICSRRLSQYMYHLQHRPPENRIAYWRKFVAEYFAPCAKKRWCLSLCHSVRLRAINLFPQAAMDTWKCELCGTKSGRGFEATFEMLPRLNKVQFESGIFDELLFLELPREYGLPSGLMVLEYGKAVHETVFEQFRIIREGQLRIVFTLDLKILSWEFCSRDHEELLHRSLIASQVNKFVHAAQKYQAAISNGGSDKTSSHNQEENQAMLLSAGCKLGKKFDIQLVGELGFPKRFIRCLQIADIFNSMRDLMTLSWKNKIGPIESLKNYSQKITETKLQKDEFQAKEKLDILQGMATDATNLSSTSHGHNSNGNDNSNISKDGLLTSSEKAALAHPGDYCKLLRQTSLSSNISKLKESSCLFMFTDHKGAFQDPNSLKLDFSHNLTRPSSHFPESTRNLQDAMIQKLLLEMFNDCEAMNQAEKEAVNHNINSVLASKMTNAKGTGTSGDATTSKSGIVAKASGFVEAASFMDSSKDCGITREPTLQKRSILPEVLAMFNGLKENEIAKVIHGSSIGYDWKT